MAALSPVPQRPLARLCALHQHASFLGWLRQAKGGPPRQALLAPLLQAVAGVVAWQARL